ncbi:MAG: roadblock/LC7 domain-containing protein [Actinobacteria bacterium]|nr:roadblock/LC7 domain-containing protein [Actinomycetota bacterium]
MDAAAALADLTEISSQVETAALYSSQGPILASTFADDTLAERLVGAGRSLLAAAQDVPIGAGRTLTQLHVALRGGSVFVVSEGEHVLAATTAADPTAGLVLYDLRTCLRAFDATEPKPAPRRRRKKTADA